MGPKTESTRHSFLLGLVHVAIWVLIFALIAAVVAWLLGWHSLLDYVNALALVALAPLALATTSAIGGRAAAADLRYHYSRSVMPDSLRDRTYQSMRDLTGALNFSANAAVVGIILLLVAAAIYVGYWSLQPMP